MFNLALTLRPSYRLAALLFFIHAGAILILFVLNLPWWLSIIAMAGCLFSLIQTWRNQALLTSATAIKKIEADYTGAWRIQNNQGQSSAVLLRGDSLCTRLLVILNFNPANTRKKITIVICRDALTSEDFKNLRRYLLALRN